MTRNTLSLSLLVLLVTACNRAPEPKTPTLGQAGERAVSETSFKRAYLPVILYGDKFDSPKTRRETLEHLMGQKILAQEAEKAQLDTMVQVQRATEIAERKSLSRQLYQTWVQDELEPATETDIRNAFLRSRKDVLVRHLFAEDSATAQAYHDALTAGTESFHTISQRIYEDTTLAATGGLLGWMGFGALDEALEDTVWSLPLNTPSQPVRSQYGWHVLQVDDWHQELFVAPEDLERERLELTQEIMLRREEVLAKRVLNDYMHSQDLEFNREIARQVFPIIIENLDVSEPDLQEQTGGPEFAAMRADLEHLKDETLITFNGEAWTVETVLRRLPELSRRHLYGNLYVAVSYLVRDELLAREAREMGLDKHPDVLSEVEDSRDLFLARIYNAMLADTMIFNDEQVRAYYDKRAFSDYHAPDRVLVREILVFDADLARELTIQAKRGAPLDSLARIHTERTAYRDLGGLLGWLDPTSPFPAVYDAARRVAINAIIGPLEHDGGWSILQVLDRERKPLAFEEVAEQVKEDMEQTRFSTAREIALERVLDDYHFEMDTTLLYSLWHD